VIDAPRPGPGASDPRTPHPRVFASSDCRHNGCLTPLAILPIEESLGVEGIRRSRDTRARALCGNPHESLQAAVLIDAQEVLGCGNRRHRANLSHFDAAGTSRLLADVAARAQSSGSCHSWRHNSLFRGSRHCLRQRPSWKTPLRRNAPPAEQSP
jgi:hypothetical protein